MSQLYFLLGSGLLFINVVAFVLVGLDKKSSTQGGQRSSEVSFFILAALLGSLGVFLGLFVFRHKTQKVYFPVGIGLLLVQQIILLLLLNRIYTGF